MLKITAYDLRKKSSTEMQLVKDKTFKYEGDSILDKPYKVADAIKDIFDVDEMLEERLYCLALSQGGKLVGVFEVSHGGINSSDGNVLGLFKRLLLLPNAPYFVLTHNHPSGNPKPSTEDVDFTERVKEGAELLGLTLLDHIIIAKDSYFSFNHSSML